LSSSSEARRFVYKAKAGTRLLPYLAFGGTIIFWLGAAAGFAFCITRPPEQDPGPLGVNSLATMPILLGGGLLLYGFFVLRTPRRIELNRQAIVIETRRTTREIPWEEFEYVEVDRGMGRQYERLVLRDRNREKLAVLSGALENFHDLSERVQRISTKRTGNPTLSASGRRTKPMALFFCFFGLLTAAGTAFMGWSAWSEQNARRLMASEGVTTDAKILKHVMFNNVAPRVEYSFQDAGGREFHRDTMLMTGAWKKLEGAETVPVRYIRSNPDYSRLIAGESHEAMNEPAMLLLAAVGLMLMSALFLTVGVLRWYGLDITFDEKTRRFRLKRLGGPVAAETARPTEA
jgi:hypothetical protein